MAIAELLCERNELERAEQHIHHATELTRVGGHTDNLLIATLTACRIQRARGNLVKAQKLITKAEDLATRTVSWMKTLLIDEQVSLYLAQGKSNEAAAWLQQHQTPAKSRSLIPRLNEQIIWKRVRVARHESRESLVQLAALLEQAQNLGLYRWVIQIRCLQALELNFQGQTNEALNMLKSALALAEPEGSIQVFLDEGPAILELLHLVHKREPASAYISRLVAAFTACGYGKIIRPAPERGILSKREIELLRKIASGFTNKEIASELVISVGTVKRHTVNIFTKLDVKNRTEAVAKARELGFI